MDLVEDRGGQRLRAEIRAFIADNLTDELRRAGSLMTSIFADFEASMKWHDALYRRGWAAPTWPKEYGGAGWNTTQYAIFIDEMISR